MTLADEIRNAQWAERRRLAELVRGWRLQAARAPRTVWAVARRRRGPSRRPQFTRTPQNGSGRGDGDPHIDGAPPVAVGREEVAHV